jgi:glycosyltransferase involved in cell wall biosynthesis
MTSIWYECQPLVTIEAQSHGLPIICSDSCASREEVTDGIDGFLFHSKDAESLEAALLRLMDDETAERLGRAAYAKVWRNPPSAKRHLIDLYEIYDQVLNATS